MVDPKNRQLRPPIHRSWLRLRAERYRPQLEAYSEALARVLERPVGRRILCFLHAGETVEL